MAVIAGQSKDARQAYAIMHAAISFYKRIFPILTRYSSGDRTVGRKYLTISCMGANEELKDKRG